MPLKQHLPDMKPVAPQSIKLPYHEPAYGYFEGMEDRTMRRIRDAANLPNPRQPWLTNAKISVAGTALASVIALVWFFTPTQSRINLDQVHESELVSYLSQNADVHELATHDPQLIHQGMLPESLPTPAEQELDELLDASTFDQIQEL